MSLRRRVRGKHALAALVVGVILVALTVALTSRSSGGRAGPAVTDLGITVPKVHVVKPPKVTRLDRLARLGLPLYCGGGKRPLVALTFDDGPGLYSRRIIRILRR